MNLTTQPARKVQINITSLIDVLFLLLIFFMISSTFVEQPGMKLDLPQAETSEIMEVKNLVLTIDADELLTLNKALITIEDLGEALQAGIAEFADATLILKADETVSHGMVVRVMDVAKKNGIKKLVIGTRQ